MRGTWVFERNGGAPKFSSGSGARYGLDGFLLLIVDGAPFCSIKQRLLEVRILFLGGVRNLARAYLSGHDAAALILDSLWTSEARSPLTWG